MNFSLRTLWPYMRHYRVNLALGMGALVVKDFAGAALPLAIRGSIDALAAGGRLPIALRFAVLLVGISLVKGFFQYWMRVILIGVSRDVEFDLRNDLFAHLVTLSPDFYRGNQTGDIMARATNDLNAVRMMLGPGVMYWTETSLTFALAIAVMGWSDWRMMALSLLPAPLVSLAVIFFGRRIHALFEHIQGLFSDISSRVQENLAGARMVRAFVQERAEIEKFERLNRDYIAQNFRLVRVQAVFQPLLEALIGLTFLSVLGVGGLQVLSGRISLGNFVMFNTYMGMLVWPMIALGWVVNLMQRGTASLSRINQLMAERPTIAPPLAPRSLRTVGGHISFEDVTVAYPSGRAVDRVMLEIEPSQTIAVVGHTGCGKSTLIQLIPRLLDPTSGVVRVDGVDLRDLSPEDLRRHIGFVPQETFLFSTTIAENIAFGLESRTIGQAEIRRAAEIAGLAEDIESFPNGYQTMVGERGLTLSGGQKQRTAIARALLREPRILVLDEALSSVDTITEEKILNELAGVMRGRTVVLISHRVSTVRQADQIVVMAHGRIVEKGSHTQLLNAGNWYADLAQKQTLEEELEAI